MWWKACPFHYGSQIITLNRIEKDITYNGVPITHIDSYGAYDVTVHDSDDPDNGTVSTFKISANKHKGGSVFCETTVIGLHNECVCMEWNKGWQHPRLRYRNAPASKILNGIETQDVPESQRFKVCFRKTI